MKHPIIIPNPMKFLSCLTLALALPAVPARSESEKVLATFEAEDSGKGWTSVNDSVMGGVSKGGFERTDRGTLLFKGNLSLENNGGFSSIRSNPKPMNLSGTEALSVRAKGDGRTYWLELRVKRQMRASSYRADFPTTAEKWEDVLIPIENFKLQAFGQLLPSEPLNLEDVESVGFTLADKKEGEFKLEIESIKAVGEVAAGAVGINEGTIVDVAKASGQFKTLLAAAGAAELAGALGGDGALTVFAPTDEAFAKLPEGAVRDLLKPENKAKLAAILKYHLIPGKVTLANALAAGEAQTLQGAKLGAKFEDGRVLINSAQLLKADIPASNGIIHVIDSVLLPPASITEPLGAAGLIELAISRGVPLFNDGNEAGCAAVYEITCENIRAHPQTSKKSRATLAEALIEMREETTARGKAWILRAALDKVYADLAADQNR
jgi:uncharacterized surface protein with fasciclin (FAS1) repeats